MDLVRKNCGGDTWEAIPGASMSMTRSGFLVVMQSAEVHGEVESLLNQMRLHK